MHGLFLLKLKPFLAEKLLDEEEGWSLLFQRANVEYTVFLPHAQYDSEVAARLFYAVAELRDEDYRTFLRAYGNFLFPELMSMYAHSFRLEDRTLFGFLRELESVYTRLSGHGSSLEPPRIRFEAESRRKGLLYFRSAHDRVGGLCHLAHGLVEGASRSIGGQMGIKHAECVERGNPLCVFELRPRMRSSQALPTVNSILRSLDRESDDDG